jgi:hypothetical protein
MVLCCSIDPSAVGAARNDFFSSQRRHLAYLTTVTAAAYIRMGEVDLARGLLNEQSSKLNPSESYWFPLQNLLAFTKSGQPEALVPAGRR